MNSETSSDTSGGQIVTVGSAGDGESSSPVDGVTDGAPGGLPTDPAALHKMIGDLRKEAAGYRTQVRDLEPFRVRATELEEASKSELQRATEAAAQAAARASDAESRLMRIEVANAAGIPVDQAHRLVGSTVEELTADAEQFASILASQSGSQPVPTRPRETMRGSGSLDAGTLPETDMRKMVERIPRI
jgi:hypothetical protein